MAKTEVTASFGVELEATLGTATSQANQKGRITFTEKSICLGLGNSYIDYTEEFANSLGFVDTLPAISSGIAEKTFAYETSTSKLYLSVKNQTTNNVEWKEIPLGSSTGGFNAAQDTAPTNPQPNQTWFDTSTGMIYIYKEILNENGTGTGTYGWTLPKDTTSNVVPETEQYVTKSELIEALTIKNFDVLVGQP